MSNPVSKVQNKRIQSSIIKHLEKYGTLQINLPDDNLLEIGVLEEDDQGNLKRGESYCYVIVKNEMRATVIDKYNLGIRFSADENLIVMDDKFIDSDGKNVKTINVA
jgi:hypothetical protein